MVDPIPSSYKVTPTFTHLAVSLIAYCSGFGHDKSRAILPYRDLPNPPTLFFFGDGVSDMSAAKHADILFTKMKDDSENDLDVYCTKEGIPHIRFRNFSDAFPVVRDVVEGKKNVEEALKVEDV